MQTGRTVGGVLRETASGSTIVLASASPRRSQLLGLAGVAFTVDPPEIDETPRPREDPGEYVGRLAVEKAAAVAGRHPDALLVIAADTTVALGDEIFGKPDDADDARRMLRRLAGRAHEVHTGVAVVRAGRVESAIDTTMVTMEAFGEAEIEWYLATGEPFGKAGAYALQGSGGALVGRVEGSVSNVIGLPMTLLRSLARRQGIELLGSHHNRLGPPDSSG